MLKKKIYILILCVLLLYLLLNKKAKYSEFFSHKINLNDKNKKKVKILLFNDCGPVGHSGSKTVTELIEKYLFRTYNVELLKKVTRYKHKEITNFNYDFIIVNGEGAFHDNQSDFRSLLKHIYDVKITKYLINSCFYNDDIDKKYISQFDLIYTREIISHQELLKKHNLNSILMLDLTFYYFHFKPKNQLVKNEYYNKILITDFNEFKIKYKKVLDLVTKNNIKFVEYKKFKTLSWDENINNFSNSKFVITDMQHVLINCIISRSKFICFTSNIPKNEGILKTLECKIPIIKNLDQFNLEIFNFLNGKYDTEFEILFDRVEKLKFNLKLKIYENPYYFVNPKVNILLIGNSNEKKIQKFEKFTDIIRFNHINTNDYFTIHVINSKELINHYKENCKKFKNLKLIIGDQKNILSNKEKLYYEYMPNYFFKEMRKITNQKKNFSIGMCAILYYLYYKNYPKVYISNFNLDLKYNKNKIINSKMSDNHDWVNEKKIIKSLIKKDRIINLSA